MKSSVVYSLSLATVLTLSACSHDKIPGVYRIDIQQGNNVSQDMINQLQPGMTKNQVAYVMGTPLLVDTFHPNRWDYIYSYQPGGDDREQRRITLYFDEDETLKHIEGDTRTVAREDLPQIERQDKNVVVPLSDKKSGFFAGFMNLIGLGEDEIEIIEDDGSSTAEEVNDEANEVLQDETGDVASPGESENQTDSE